MAVGASQAFTSTTYDQYNNARSGDTVAWSVSNAMAGSINSSSGAFTAGTVAGTYTNAVVATSGAINGNASVTINPGPPNHITINQHDPSIVVGAMFTFTATTYDQYNNALGGGGITWRWSGPNVPPGYMIDDGGGVARNFGWMGARRYSPTALL